MGAAAKKTRKAVVDGAEHTDASLASMKTGEIAALVAAIKGGKPPKPATKTKAIELIRDGKEQRCLESKRHGAAIPQVTHKKRDKFTDIARSAQV